MRRGGWVLGAVAALALSGGAFIVLRPVLARKSGTILFVTSEGLALPALTGTRKGIEFALLESGSRAGPYRLNLLRQTVRDFIAPDGTPVVGTVSLESDLGQVEVYHAIKPWVATLDTGPEHAATNCDFITPRPRALGRAAAGWLRVRTALVVEKDTYRAGLIAAAFVKDHPSIVLKETVEKADPGLAKRILDAAPEAVFFAGEDGPYTLALTLFADLRRAGYAGTMALAEAAPEVSLLDHSAPLVEGMHLVSPLEPSPPEFASRFEQAMGRPPGIHTYSGYLATRAILDMLDRGLDQPVGFLPTGETATNPAALYIARNGRFEFVRTLK